MSLDPPLDVAKDWTPRSQFVSVRKADLRTIISEHAGEVGVVYDRSDLSDYYEAWDRLKAAAS